MGLRKEPETPREPVMKTGFIEVPVVLEMTGMTGVGKLETILLYQYETFAVSAIIKIASNDLTGSSDSIDERGSTYLETRHRNPSEKNWQTRIEAPYDNVVKALARALENGCVARVQPSASWVRNARAAKRTQVAAATDPAHADGD